jgi:hypothetical protein
MASEIDVSALTLTPEEATDVSMAVFETAYAKPEIATAHDVRTGIQMKTQIPFFGQLGLVGKASSGCTPNAGGVITATEKYWDPVLVDFRLTHCEGDLSQLFKLWKRNRVALKTWEEVDNEMLAFIADRAVQATAETILRITSFGDKAGKLIANGGVLTAGTDITYFTMLDGLWKQIFTAKTAGDITAYHEIEENGQASYAAQLALDDDAAIKVLRGLYSAIDPRVFTMGNLVFEMTRTLFNNWQDYMEKQSLAFTMDRTEQGATKWSYRGIPIIVRNDWDRNILAYEDNGTTYNKPHRALLSPLSNIPVGTSDTESLSNFDSFYDKVTRQHYVDVAFYIDAKELEEYAIAVAY